MTHGLAFLGLLIFSIIWYRAIWLPSPYVEGAYSDHFTYLNQSFIILSPAGYIGIPSVWEIAINSFGHSFLIALLFRFFEESTFLVIASQIVLISWATICLTHLFLLQANFNRNSKIYEKNNKIAYFQILPGTIIVAGTITKDSLLLFGVALAIASYGELYHRFSLPKFLLLGIGFFLAAMTRVEYAVLLPIVFLISVFFVRFTTKQAVIYSVFLFFGVALLAYLAKMGLLALYDPSPMGLLENLRRVVEKDLLEGHSETSTFLYRLARPFGDSFAARIISVPIAGCMSWFVPFPYILFDYRAILHTSGALANILSLSITITAFRAFAATLHRILRRQASHVETLIAAVVFIYFAANALSQIPMPRYRLPFDWAIMFFFAMVSKPSRPFQHGLLISLILASIAHMLYYALGGGT